ncbi:pirin [Duganella sp. Leaf126]|uniref:pirin family protein n=1 Tax=Duganella sp. Leaf126 TaxID=1736266 RepID=UPI0006FC86C4|nr:pirin family protein [Duganella sp. Leaf126]KQQ31917.1 pirin [Duganella sp. Leaf126]
MQVILGSAPLGMPWATMDPFLFCVHHVDGYPKGNGKFGPAAALSGRQIGQDFASVDGWNMYHGEQVPGFPGHPHRGFETVTIVRRGLIDHADSLGAAARFGAGDVQWLTAGRGVVHSEMFPLLKTDADNPLELFQIWLNLPARSKLVEPHFTMLWSEDVPRQVVADAAGARTEIMCVAGKLAGVTPLAPPPDSWAAADESDVAIWVITMEPGAAWTLPPTQGARTKRALYYFDGDGATVGGEALAARSANDLRTDVPLLLKNGARPAQFLVLQGRPIGERVVQAGPFVMNSEQEIRQAHADYQRTGFGGWPWPDPMPVHGDDPTRFARHVDGRVERRDR